MACIKKRRNRWVIDFYDQFGKRRWKTLPVGTNKTDAKTELRTIEDQVAKGVYLPNKKIPTFSKVADDWLEYKKPNVRISYWEVLEGHTRNYFDELDDLKINRITTATVEKYITDRQSQGMHILTLRKILVTMGQIFKYAVRHKYIDHNPLADAERPRARGYEQHSQDQVGEQPEDQIMILTPEQVTTLFDNIQSPKYRTLIMLTTLSGARQGEILGLKWSDIGWQSKQIHIKRSYYNGRFFPPKTKTSKRKIDLGPKIMTELKKWKLACPKNSLNLVFPNEAGGPIDHNNLLQRHFYKGLKDAGLPRVRFHNLRHTYASLMIEQGENLKYIQTQLGHSSPTVTLNVYAHLMQPTNQKAACRLEDTIFGTTGSKTVANTKKEVSAKSVTP